MTEVAALFAGSIASVLAWGALILALFGLLGMAWFILINRWPRP